MSFEDGIKMWREDIGQFYDEHFSEEEMEILYEIVRGNVDVDTLKEKLVDFFEDSDIPTFCIGHVAPEAVDGGPIAFVRDGDIIRIDVPSLSLDLVVDDDELARRRDGWEPIAPRYTSGVLGKYARLAQGAERGAITNPL